MIVRRIARNLSAQDWGAAVIELVIVVLGIFLALQVSAWYEAWQERQQEDQMLARLLDDFSEIRNEADKAVTVHQEVIEGLVLLQQSLAEGTLEAEDRNAILSGLRNVLNVDTGAGLSSTYREAVSSGQLRIVTSRQLLLAMAEYEELVNNSTTLFSEFRMMQMEYEVAFNRHIQFGVPERFGSLGFHTAKVVDFDFNEMLQDKAFRLALARMTTFQTYYQIWHLRTLGAASRVLQHLEGQPKDS